VAYPHYSPVNSYLLDRQSSCRIWVPNRVLTKTISHVFILNGAITSAKLEAHLNQVRMAQSDVISIPSVRIHWVAA
jgi:hypothetical protein